MNGRKKVGLRLARLVLVWSIILAVAVGPMAAYGDTGVGAGSPSATFGVEPDGAMHFAREGTPREEGVNVYGLPSWTTDVGDYGNGGGGDVLPSAPALDDGDGGSDSPDAPGGDDGAGSPSASAIGDDGIGDGDGVSASPDASGSGDEANGAGSPSAPAVEDGVKGKRGVGVRAAGNSSDHWIDKGDGVNSSFVYTTTPEPAGTGADNRAYTAVTNWAELKAALDFVNGEGTGTFNVGKPYVIYIDATAGTKATIQMGERYTITDKNIELRKASGTTAVTISPMAASATENEARHFYVTGNTSKLVLENGIVLDGGASVAASPYRGGICDVAAGFIFSGKIQNCNNFSGGAIALLNSNGSSLELDDAILSHNFADNVCGGVGLYNWSSNNQAYTVTIKGNSIIENNYAGVYAGGIGLRNNANNHLTITDNTIIRDNESGVGGGIYLHAGTLDFKGNAEISGNVADIIRPRGTNVAYSGGGGGIFTSGIGTAVLNMRGNVKLINNVAARGGGGIQAGVNTTTSGNQTTINLYGGKISGNKALGTARELVSGANRFDGLTIGGGGGILASAPRKINISSDSTIEFGDNYAPFIALYTKAELLANASTTDVTSITGFAGDDYYSHILKEDVPASFNRTPYTTLYNNYDIGVPSNMPKNSFSEMTVVASGRGRVAQSDSQLAGYMDVFGDGRMWKELNQPTKLNFTAQPQPGYRFTGWSYASDPPLLDAEWDTAFGTAPAIAVSEAAITGFSMPNVHVTLTADFSTAAVLNAPAPLAFTADTGSGTAYTQPAAQAVDLYNSGTMNATGASITLSGFTKDGIPWTGAAPFAVSGSNRTIAPNTTDSSITVRPAAGIAAAGVYGAIMTLTYYDGAGQQVTKNGQVAFALTQNNVPAVIALLSDFDFGTANEGYTSTPSRPLILRNYGNVPATITNIELTGNDADCFTLTPAPYTGTVAGRGGGAYSEDTHWTLRPKAGLAAGSYTASLTATYDGDKVAGVEYISFRVAGPAKLSASDLRYNALEAGYAMSPIMSVVIENEGDTDATITDVKSDVTAAAQHFNVSGGTSKTVEAQGMNDSFRLSPKAGLASGEYTESFTVSYTGAGFGGTRTCTFTARLRVVDYLWLESVQMDGMPRTQTSGVVTLNFAKPMKMAWGDLDITGAAVKSGSAFTSVSGDKMTYTVPVAVSSAALEGNRVNVAITIDPSQTMDETSTSYSAIISGPLKGDNVLRDGASAHVRHELASAVPYTQSGLSTSYIDVAFSSAPGILPLTDLASANGLGNNMTLVSTYSGSGGMVTVSRVEKRDAIGFSYRIWLDSVEQGGTMTLGFGSKYGVINAPVSVSVIKGAAAQRLLFNANGGTDGTVTNAALSYGQAFGPLPGVSGTAGGPARAGYTLAGWSTGSAIGSPVNVSSAAVCDFTGDLIVYAVWTERTDYRVTYDLNGGTSAPIGNMTGVTWGAIGLLPASSPARTGYTFENWRTASSGGSEVTATTSYAALAAGNDAVTTAAIYARWAATSNNRIVYNPNGGVSGSITSSAGLVYDGVYSVPGTAAPTRTGYSFGGWSTASSAVSPDFANSGVVDWTGDKNVYAVWNATAGNSLVLSANGGMPGTTVLLPALTYGGTYTVPSDAAPSRYGYVFSGWAKTVSAASSDFADNASRSFAVDWTGLRTVYAVWSASANNSLTFDSNGGIANTTTSLSGLTFGRDYIIPQTATPSRAGFEFLGWGSSAGMASPDVGSPFTVSWEGGRTVWAVWAAKSDNRLVFDAGAGAAGSTAQLSGLVFGGGYAVPGSAVPSRTGYVFAGWSASSAAVLADFPEMGSVDWAGVKTVYAVWSARTDGALVFTPNDAGLQPLGGASTPGAVGSLTGLTFGAVYTVPAAASPEHYGYNFIGWATAPGGTVPDFSSSGTVDWTGSKTVYGLWHPTGNNELVLDSRLGTGVPIRIVNLEYSSSYSIPQADEPSRAGYTFGGWASTAAGAAAGAADFASSGTVSWTGVKTVYAVWTALSGPSGSAVLFDANGGVLPSAAASGMSGLAYGSAYTVPSDFEPVRAGHDFIGWAASMASAAAGVADFSSSATVDWTGSRTVYAVWQAKAASLVFDAGPGVPGSVGVQSGLVFGGAYSVAAGAVPSRTGYSFAGWATSVAFAGLSVSDFALSGTVDWTGSRTVYAVWKPAEYTLFFDSNGGIDGSVSSRSVLFGSAVGALPDVNSDAPSRPGYVFAGWSRSPGIANPRDFDAGVVYLTPADTVLYAVWSTPPVVYLQAPVILASGDVRVRGRVVRFDKDFDAAVDFREAMNGGLGSGALGLWTRISYGNGVSASEWSFDVVVPASAAKPGTLYEVRLRAEDTDGRAASEFAYFRVPGPDGVVPGGGGASGGGGSGDGAPSGEAGGSVVNNSGSGTRVYVTLQYGNISIMPSAVLDLAPGASGRFSFSGVPDGWYNVVCDDGHCRVTEMVHAEGGTAARDISVDFGRKQSRVQVVGGVQGVAAGGLPDLFGNPLVYTSDDAALVAGGGMVEMKLLVGETNARTALEAAAEADGLSGRMYFGMNVVKSRFDKNGVLLGSELVDDLSLPGGGAGSGSGSGGGAGSGVGGLIEVAVPLAGHLEGKTAAAVLRMHDGVIGSIAPGRGLAAEFGSGPAGLRGIGGEFFFQDDARQYVLMYTGKFSGHAIAVQKYRLTVAAGPHGSVVGTSSGYYFEGDAMGLVALPEAGYRFTGWSVSAAGGIRVSEKLGVSAFAMPAGDVDMRANFEPVRAAGNVSPGGGSGSGGGGVGAKLPALSKVKIGKVKVGKKKLTVAWKKAAASQKAWGYQVSYRVFKVVKKKVGKKTVNRIKAGKWKSKSVSGAAKKSYAVKKLKKGKRYQVRVRSWRVENGKKVYGKWSAVKKSRKVK